MLEIGAVPPQGGNNIHVLFHRRRRKRVCAVCWSLVHRKDVLWHAIHHVAKGEGDHRTTTHEGFMLVSVYPDHTVHTGWLTDDLSGGPG